MSFSTVNFYEIPGRDARAHTHTHAHIRTHTHTVYMHTHNNTHICISTVYTQIHVCTHIHTHTFSRSYTHTPQDPGKGTKKGRHDNGFPCTPFSPPSLHLSPSPSPSPSPCLSVSLAALFALSPFSPPGSGGLCVLVARHVHVCMCVCVSNPTPPTPVSPLVALPPSSLVYPSLAPFMSLSNAWNLRQLLGSHLRSDHLQCFLNTKPKPYT